ncbi:MAG: hypothetical protein FWH06_04635, partial [Oscillospiraceae bacterium]|nr:hypothetical protein [Oscillospiraceae bacterium]
MITGGLVTNAATVNSNPVIYMNGGLGLNVTVGGGHVRASDHNLGYGIQTTGDVLIENRAVVEAGAGRAVNLVGMNSKITVTGGEVKASTAGVAICTATTNPATVANAQITISGGKVYTEGTDAGHNNGRAIYATGANNVVTVSGGWVYTESNETEAIYITGTDSIVTVTGGQVSAKGHFAIEAYSGGSVYIDGGFVFAYGTAPLSPETGAKIEVSAVGAISLGRIHINESDPAANGVVAVWDRVTWAGTWSEADYTQGLSNHISSKPDPLSGEIYWKNNGGNPFDGIYYSSGGNVGFFPLAEVNVVTPPPVLYYLEVINGTGSDWYEE